MKGKAVRAVFWALVAFFAIEMGVIISGAANGYTIFGGGVIIVGLGAALIILTLRAGVEGSLKVFLLITGAAPVAMVLFVLLHNLVYALGISAFGADFWNGGDEPFFFILGIIVCPLAFITGVAGSIVLTIRE